MLEAAQSVGIRSDVASGLQDFDHLIRQYQQRVYRLILAQIGEVEIAEELTQECFVRAYQHRDSFRGDSQIYTWLARIAINLTRDYFRNRKLAFWRKLVRFDSSEDEEERAIEVPDGGASPEEQVMQQERLAEAMAIVRRLSPPQRETLLLSVIEEMSLEEIARCTNRRIGTVKTHLFRAMLNLRKWQGEGKPTSC